jgi:hypothetical protein
MCPLMHGTITTDPYPGGYVHGKNPAICKFGCLPEKGKTVSLEQEATEFMMLCSKELQWSA